MENEELAALRASLVAATRQPAAVRARHQRIGQVFADGNALIPYVLAPSCSDPRDRAIRVKSSEMRHLLGARTRLGVDNQPEPRYEPSPFRPAAVAGLVLAVALLTLALHLLTQALLLRAL